MKKHVKNKRVIGIALLAALLTVLIIIPLSAGAGDNPGEGGIPIPSGFDIKSSGEQTGNPEELEEGQIFVNKNVVDNEDGTFVITLYVWGAEYDDKNDATQSPLDPDHPDVTINDTIGDWFDYNEDAVYYAGDLSVDSDGEAVWIISQDDILDGMQLCTFTVSLKEGWVVETPYYTNAGASAHFTPAVGNPYYYKTSYWTETTYKELFLNWNHGVNNGLNGFAISDTELGVTLDLRSYNADPRVNVTYKDGTQKIFTFNQNYYSYTSAYVEPVNASDGQWGFFWVREEGKFKTLQFWFKGLEAPGIVTCYDFAPGNNGGNDTFTIDIATHEYSRTEKILLHPWIENGPEIGQILPNKGVVELSCVTITVYKEITGDDYTGTRPTFRFGMYNNYECDGEPLVVAELAGSAEDMSAVFHFAVGSLLEYFDENEDTAIFWIKEIAGAEDGNGGKWKYDTNAVEVMIDRDGNVTFEVEIDEGENYPVFINNFTIPDPEPEPSPPEPSPPEPSPPDTTPTDSGNTYTPPTTTTTITTTTTTTQTTPETEPIVAPPVDIIDEAPPLTDFPPDELIPDDELFVELDDDIVPLSDMPQTGIESMVRLWIFGICASMLAMGLLVRVIHRGRKEK